MRITKQDIGKEVVSVKYGKGTIVYFDDSFLSRAKVLVEFDSLGTLNQISYDCSGFYADHSNDPRNINFT